jgi:creatinine amidohydrolase
LRPDQLAAVVEATPVAFWPLGLLEHHGWHLPVGLDGLKAERICRRIAAETGGVILPTMWWGGGGGHGGFMWTLYQPVDAAEQIVVQTITRLIVFGFRAIVLLAGHYPWQEILNRRIPAMEERHPEVMFLRGTEMNIGGEGLSLPGDHAAREETSYGLALHPEFVDMGELTAGRGESAWPGGKTPAEIPEMGRMYPGLVLNPADALFAQYGVDARRGSRERGEAHVSQLVAHLARRLNAYLGETAQCVSRRHIVGGQNGEDHRYRGHW